MHMTQTVAAGAKGKIKTHIKCLKSIVCTRPKINPWCKWLSKLVLCWCSWDTRTCNTVKYHIFGQSSQDRLPPMALTLDPPCGCHLFCSMPLSEPMLTYCRLDHKEHISMKFYWKFRNFYSRKCIWKYRLKNAGHFTLTSMCWYLLWAVKLTKIVIKKYWNEN